MVPNGLNRNNYQCTFPYECCAKIISTIHVDETLTIVVALNQCLKYKNAYKIGRVCFNVGMKTYVYGWKHLYK
jgi:hypothetical protein